MQKISIDEKIDKRVIETVDCQEGVGNRSFVLVKIGSNEFPASEDDVKNMEKSLSKLGLDGDIKFLVTHHNVGIEVIHA